MFFFFKLNPITKAIPRSIKIKIRNNKILEQLRLLKDIKNTNK